MGRRASVLTLRLPYLVAERAGRIVGYSCATACRHTLEDSAYVADGLGRQGIGSELLGTLIARCEAGSWPQMIAIIGDGGNSASIALHRRMGFRPAGTLELVSFKLDRWIDTVLMQRPLGPGADSLPA